MPIDIQKKRAKTTSPKRLSPTATFLLSKAVPGYSTLMSISCFANEIACATEEDYEDYDVLRKLITVTTYADGDKTGKFSCAKLWHLIDAEDHSELVRTLEVLAKYDIPLNCALKECDYPDYDELSDCIEDEMKTFLVARAQEAEERRAADPVKKCAACAVEVVKSQLALGIDNTEPSAKRSCVGA